MAEPRRNGDRGPLRKSALWRGLKCFVFPRRSPPSHDSQPSALFVAHQPRQTAAAGPNPPASQDASRHEDLAVEHQVLGADDAARRRDLVRLLSASARPEKHPSLAAAAPATASERHEHPAKNANSAVEDEQSEIPRAQVPSPREPSQAEGRTPSPDQRPETGSMATNNLATPGGISDPALLQ